ncbi:MAG TPA: L,D-transpeptidase family protein [Acidimicrobiales bacterium]|nr:L,D-transpeptidase family protein [Acidimicrobiales bacterium]
MGGARVRTAVAVTALVAVLSACSGGDDDEDALDLSDAAGQVEAATTSTSSTAPSTTTTTAAPVTAPPASKPPPPGLGPGSRGPEVASLEQRLEALRYDPGRVDGTYDQNTAYAVTAFQKVHGMARTGRATDDVVARVNTANSPPPALVPGGGSTRVEIDLDRQVLFLYEGNNLSKILPVSSGNNKRFCSEGWCRRAITRVGSFAVYRQARGWEKSPLGRLYNPLYFDGGIAVHGSQSVPASPASHGCVRIPMAAAEWFPSRVTLGTPVYVAGNGTIPAPRATAPPPPPDSAAAVGVPGASPPPATFTPPDSTAPPQATTTTRPPGLVLLPPPSP